MPSSNPITRREQYKTLRQIEDWLEVPMFVLSLVWVALLVVELVYGAGTLLQRIVTAIWIVFIVEFAFRFVIAPSKFAFLRKSWISVLALVLPAIRVFRVARAIKLLRFGRAIRGITLARVITAFNRGLRSLQASMSRFGFSYIFVLTALVTLLGAAGMFAFERGAEGGLRTFTDALWFTAMLMTTSGSDYWPKSPEGRILCFLLAVYAFAIFGYITASLATLLIGQQSKPEKQTGINASQMAQLRAEIAELNARLANAPPFPKNAESQHPASRP
jgi:voltage-gated potassium channel